MIKQAALNEVRNNGLTGIPPQKISKLGIDYLQLDISKHPLSLWCGSSDRTFAANAKSAVRGTGAVRTQSTFADAAFAYAENVRTRGGEISATQRISPNQPFNRINFAEFQTTHSLR